MFPSHLSWILHGSFRHAVHRALALGVVVPSTVHVLAAVAGHHAPHGRVVQVHVEVGGDLPAVLDVEQRQGDVERLHLQRDESNRWSVILVFLKLNWWLVRACITALK